MKFGVEDKEFLLSKSNSKTLPEWFDHFGGTYTKNQIYSLCYRNNLEIKKLPQEEKSKIQKNNCFKHPINDKFFSVWSDDMAYVLGFWFADGCIYSGKVFDITVHKKDKYILKRIAELLGYKGDIKDASNKQACRINFSNINIYNDLIKLGGSERKSLSVTYPAIPKKYLSHFIRGYFDGDGCIMNLKNNRVNSAFTCGNKSFLVALHRDLKKYAGITGGGYDDSCCSLKFGKRDTLLLGEFIYKNSNSLFLKRKRDKFNI